jgi:uncharacterized protein
MELRALGPDHLDAVLTLNEADVPRVGTLDHRALEALVGECDLALVAVAPDDRVAGFLLALAPGADYASPNYRWFAQRYRSFRYVDRIVVAPWARGAGLGRRLEDAVAVRAAGAGAPVVACEVNVDPPNPESLAFHGRLGFTEVGRQWTYGHTVEVALLVRRVDAG